MNFEFHLEFRIHYFFFFLRRDFPITIIITICRCFFASFVRFCSLFSVFYSRYMFLSICFYFLILIWLIIVSNFSIFSIYIYIYILTLFVDIFFYMFKKKETSNFIRLQQIYLSQFENNILLIEIRHWVQKPKPLVCSLTFKLFLFFVFVLFCRIDRF